VPAQNLLLKNIRYYDNIFFNVNHSYESAKIKKYNTDLPIPGFIPPPWKSNLFKAS